MKFFHQLKFIFFVIFLLFCNLNIYFVRFYFRFHSHLLFFTSCQCSRSVNSYWFWVEHFLSWKINDWSYLFSNCVDSISLHCFTLSQNHHICKCNSKCPDKIHHQCNLISYHIKIHCCSSTQYKSWIQTIILRTSAELLHWYTWCSRFSYLLVNILHYLLFSFDLFLVKVFFFRNW